MKHRYLFVYLCLVLSSSCNREQPGFSFQSFSGTPAEKLALAVMKENTSAINSEGTKANISVDYLEPKYGHSLLMLAVANKLEKSVERLLLLGANPNLRSRLSHSEDSSYVDTPMFIACDPTLTNSDGSVGILETLIRYGGKVNDVINARYEGANYVIKKTPLVVACSGKNLDIVKVLVRYGAKINDYDYDLGHGPLTAAIIQDRMAILKYLLIDAKATIPRYCFVVFDAHGRVSTTYTITDMLKKKTYRKGSDSDKIRQEILAYLVSQNFR